MTFSKQPERQIRSHTPSRRAIDTLIRSRFETRANHLCSVPKPIVVQLPRRSRRSVVYGEGERLRNALRNERRSRQSFTATDPPNGHFIKVDVTLNVVK